ncbi:MAG: hypothetical protein ABWZ76_03635 [Acidimicrobiales bacterium]
MVPCRSRLLLCAVLALGWVTACSDDPDEAAAGSSTTTAVDGTTTSAPPASTTTAARQDTTTTTEPVGEVVLRGDGLGVTALGASPDDAVAVVTSTLGEPTADTGWEPSFSSYGTCPGAQIRGVEWDHLVLLFTDEETSYGSGEHLFAWRITGAPPALGTATGFGYHATAADAEDLYPGSVETFPAEDPFPAFLVIEAEGGRITAYVDDADRVTNLEAGVPCGE